MIKFFHSIISQYRHFILTYLFKRKYFIFFFCFWCCIYSIFDWLNFFFVIVVFDAFESSIRFKSINFTKFLCFYDEKILINSFVKMLIVEIQRISIMFFWTFWRNQWRCISTWRSLMINLTFDVMKTRIVWRLSHSTCVNFFIFISIASKNRFHHIFVLIVIDMIINSTSMKLMMIVFCLKIFQSIKSSKSLKQYSFEFWRVLISFANETSKNFMNMMFFWFV